MWFGLGTTLTPLASRRFNPSTLTFSISIVITSRLFPNSNTALASFKSAQTNLCVRELQGASGDGSITSTLTSRSTAACIIILPNCPPPRTPILREGPV